MMGGKNDLSGRVSIENFKSWVLFKKECIFRADVVSNGINITRFEAGNLCTWISDKFEVDFVEVWNAFLVVFIKFSQSDVIPSNPFHKLEWTRSNRCTFNLIHSLFIDNNRIWPSEIKKEHGIDILQLDLNGVAGHHLNRFYIF